MILSQSSHIKCSRCVSKLTRKLPHLSFPTAPKSSIRFLRWPVEGAGKRTTPYEWVLFSACFKHTFLQAARQIFVLNKSNVCLCFVSVNCVLAVVYILNPSGFFHDLFDRMLTLVFSELAVSS